MNEKYKEGIKYWLTVIGAVLITIAIVLAVTFIK